MKKYTNFLRLTALLVMVIVTCSGCGLLNIAGTLNNGTVVPTNPPAGDVYYTEPYYGEDFTYSAVISNPDNTTTTVVNTPTTQNSNQTQSSEVATTSDSSPVNPTTAPTETTTINTFEDGDYLANVQDVLFNTQDESTARKILVAAGFDYDPVQDVYFTQLDSWQRNFGFNSVYDTAAPMVGMIYSTAKIYFTYDDKDWMMEIWKGQYGITAGGEIGFYNKPTDRVMKHFDCVTDEEMLEVSFDFYNMDELVFTRGPEKHWWLTGFKFLHVGIPTFITLDMTIEFPNRKMANAFEKGLKDEQKKQITDPIKYTRSGDTFNIEW
ncbi:MAG: DUF4474 domain-containing protein [Clostridia bacterium]|nr:DUF4474 domain-containing protein [Clostridia bacterium]